MAELRLETNIQDEEETKDWPARRLGQKVRVVIESSQFSARSVRDVPKRMEF